MKYVVRKYTVIVAGPVVEICAYNSPMISVPRGARTTPTDPEHETRNINGIIRKVARLLNTNYTHEDYYVTLTYDNKALERLEDGMPDSLPDAERKAYVYEQACKEFERYIRRCRYACKAAGVDLRYIGVTSDRDHRDTVDRRIHHHLVVNAEAVEIMNRVWHNGFIHAPHLYNAQDYKPLAVYMIRQARSIKGKARYKASRNLRQPFIKTELSLDAWNIPAGVKAALYHGSYAYYCMELVDEDSLLASVT